MRYIIPALLIVGLSSCEALVPYLDAPVTVTAEDAETGEIVETESTVGDVIADQSTPVATVVGNVLGGINPALGLIGAGGIAALLNGARRRKKQLPAA